MDKRIALIIAVIMGIVAILMMKNYVTSQKKQISKGLDLVPVIVATKNIQKGEVLSESNLASRDYPEQYVGSRAIRMTNFSLVLGQTIKNNLEQGKPVLWSDIELDRTEGLASVIQPGMRAVTVPVSPLTSISNMIRPGSLVDIFWTFNKAMIENDSPVASKDTEQIPDVKDVQAFREYLIRKYSKQTKSKQVTVLFKQNVRVLATDQNYLGETAPSGKNDTYSNITLLVSLLGAQEITHALNMGKFSFVLRNDMDVEKAVITPSSDESVFRSAINSAIALKEAEEEKK
ncbi:MAG: Flp pilus assembly protein [uncultured bacterium]|nr:MAG: Flp pilus assembly protein [uncultured bacterium]